MKVANVIEGGIAGATTLTLLERALQNINTKSPKLKLLNKPGIIKQLRKKAKKKGGNKIFIRLAKELLAAGSYYGIVRLGSKKNALLRGAILGAATGLGVVFAENKKDKKTDERRHEGDNDGNLDSLNAKERVKFWIKNNREEILTVALYTAGGVLAGAAIKKINKKSRKK